MRPEPAALALALLCSAAAAEGLEGRTVLFRVESWDDPAAPYLVSSDYAGVVGPGPEFGMVREHGAGLAVVPVTIDVSEGRIDFTYPGQEPSQFAAARFNGYVLTFPASCTVVAGAAVDPVTTTLPLAPDALTITPRGLSLNVAGLAFDATTTIGLLVDVTDCPMS